MKSIVRFCVLFLVCFSYLAGAGAQTPDCGEELLAGAAPQILNSKLSPKTRRLCFSQIVLLYSGMARAPLWSAERITAVNIASARSLARPRSNAFHPETALSYDERAELADYRGSGFDRGHMSPNGDMPTPEAQNESFSLANMVPQHPCHNEVLWEGIESAVRDLALQTGELYAVTGPAYLGSNLQSLNGRVLVPTHLYKAVYAPSLHAAAAYFTPNDGSQAWQVVSIANLAERVGIDPFPDLPAEAKTNGLNLPPPSPPRFGCRLRMTDAAPSTGQGR